MTGNTAPKLQHIEVLRQMRADFSDCIGLKEEVDALDYALSAASTSGAFNASVYKTAEELAAYLESLYEVNGDGSFTGRKWDVAQRAAIAVMGVTPTWIDAKALEVARRFTQDTETQRRASLQAEISEAMQHAAIALQPDCMPPAGWEPELSPEAIEEGHKLSEYLGVDASPPSSAAEGPKTEGDRITAQNEAFDIAEAYAAEQAKPDECTCPQHGNWIAADDVKRLVREIDVYLNGEAGAAKQASLCDIAGQLRRYSQEHGPLFPVADQAQAEEDEQK